MVVGASAGGVLLVVVLVVWATIHFTKSRRGDPRLLGTWQSDANETIAELRKTRPVTDKQEQAMRKIFGKMKITYTDSTITTDFDGVVQTQTYLVVGKNDDWIMVKSRSALTNQDEEFRIQFIGADAYWVEARAFALSECFKRIR